MEVSLICERIDYIYIIESPAAMQFAYLGGFELYTLFIQSKFYNHYTTDPM